MFELHLSIHWFPSVFAIIQPVLEVEIVTMWDINDGAVKENGCDMLKSTHFWSIVRQLHYCHMKIEAILPSKSTHCEQA